MSKRNRTVAFRSANLRDPEGETIPILAVDNGDGTFLIGQFVHRWSECLSSVIVSGSSLGTDVDMSEFEGGVIHVPAGWTDANIGFQMSQNGNDYFWLLNMTGDLIEISGIRTDSAACYVLPEGCWDCGKYVRPVSKSKVAKNFGLISQVATMKLYFSLKS